MLLGALALLACALSMSAQSGRVVQFDSIDQSTRVTGEIIEFDGRTYLVRTPLGDLILDADVVRCVGQSCPPETAIKSGYTIAGNPRLLTGLLPELMAQFAFEKGAELVRLSDGAGTIGFSLSTDIATAPLRVALLPSTADEAIQAMAEGRADFVLIDRSLTSRERNLIKLGGHGDVTANGNMRLLAFEPMHVIVAASNPVRSLNVSEIAEVFSSRIDDWGAFGRSSKRLTAHVALPADGARAILTDQLLSQARRNPGLELVPHPNERAVSDKVARDADAIGIVGSSAVRHARSLPIESSCGLRLYAAPFAVKSGAYPYVAPVWAYKTDTLRLNSARDFWRFLGNATAAEAIALAGFTDNGISMEPESAFALRVLNSFRTENSDVDPDDLRAIVHTLRGARRLSTTLRFGASALALTPQSETALRALADAMQHPPLLGRKIVLAGFSDGIGAPSRNASLSLAQAEQVRDALRQMLPEEVAAAEIDVHGFGEALPLLCDDTDQGRRMNKRVEVWVH